MEPPGTAVPQAARPTPGQPSAEDARWGLPLAVLIVGMFMSVLDVTIVNVAIPSIQNDLGSTLDDVLWIATAYTLTLGVVVPLSSWLGDRFGLTPVYLVTLLGFAAGSALCGVAWSLDSLILFRVIQAVPGGILPVITLTIVYQIVPRERIGAAMGMYGLGVVVAPAVGPTLGGYLVEYVDWRLIFFINVPIGILGTIAALIVFPRISPTSWPKFDLWGFLTIGYGLFAFLLACSEGQDWGWTGYRIMGLFVSGTLSLALFVVIELEVDNPIIDLRIFKVPAYSVSLILLGVVVTGLFATLYFIPQFLQNVQGLQAFDSGLVLVPSALVLVVLTPLAGRIYDKIGPRIPVAIGLVLMAYGSYLLASLRPDTPRPDIEMWTSIRNADIGLSMMSIMTAGVSALPGSLTAAGSGMNNVMQRAASSVAVAVLGSLNTSQGAQLMLDRGSLLNTGANALPGVNDAAAQGASGLLSLYQELSNAVTTQTYANDFYVIALLSAAGGALALFLRSGKPKNTGGPVHVVEL
jgi:EmrB/QacA subfamily drug resistance transporter